MALIYPLMDEAATIAFGQSVAQAIAAQTNGSPSKVANGVDTSLDKALCIYLLGDLGAGKTTLSRGIVTAFGHKGAVKSPTYTLVEPYEAIANTVSVKINNVYHFDLYRLADPAELEFLGLDEYFSASSLCLIEWPSRGEGFIPAADIQLTLEDRLFDRNDGVDQQAETIGRQISCEAFSEFGLAVLEKLAAAIH